MKRRHRGQGRERRSSRGLEALGCTVHLDPALDGDALGECLASETGAEVLVVRSTKVPAAVIERGRGDAEDDHPSRVGVRQHRRRRRGKGAGIAVCNTPGMNAVAVAELAMGHLIGLDRRFADQNAQLKGGRWNKKEFSKAKGLKGRSLLC
jgi:D-3-phosphoglycerate dehydrogenase